jgi:hypothetical protein
MVDFFDGLYTSIGNRNNLLKKIRYYSILRVIVRFCANIIVPIYFILTPGKKRYSLLNSPYSEKRLIVSLTSFPERINRLWVVIETLLRQQRKPDMIILWLSLDQFPTLLSLPQSLISLQKRGLIIRLCTDDLRSHKKYYYVMKEFPMDYIITVDDDVIYNSQLLSFLIKLNQKFPKAICCNHASRIIVKDGYIVSYKEWEIVKYQQDPSIEIMPIGVGGILYPPNSLHHDVFQVDVFKKYCFLADDIWLNLMARLQGTSVAKTAYSSHYLPIINFKNITLNSKNINEKLNDKQLNSMREYYDSKSGIDPCRNITTK